MQDIFASFRTSFLCFSVFCLDRIRISTSFTLNFVSQVEILHQGSTRSKALAKRYSYELNTHLPKKKKELNTHHQGSHSIELLAAWEVSTSILTESIALQNGYCFRKINTLEAGNGINFRNSYATQQVLTVKQIEGIHSNYLLHGKFLLQF